MYLIGSCRDMVYKYYIVSSEVIKKIEATQIDYRAKRGY